MDLNPFHFGALALGEAFTDRAREIRELRADLLNGQDVVLLGRRRFGKSSLVLRVMQELAARKVLVAYCDLSTTPTKEKLAEKLARTIHDDIASPLEKVRERAVGVFRGLSVQPTIMLDPDDATVSFSFVPGRRATDIDATIEELLALPARIGADRGRRVALVFDEFQEITEIDPAYPKLMRAVFQTQPEVAHAYLGSKRHLMQRIFNDRNEPFWRSAKQLELGPIPPAEFERYIAERFAATGRTIAADAVATILALTRGHPYATQQLCYFVWEETARRRRAALGDVSHAFERLLDSEHNHFSLVWEDASANERLLLLALAEEPGRPYSGEYRREHGLRAATNVQRSLSSLLRRELVEKEADGTYRLAEPFLREWLFRVRRDPVTSARRRLQDSGR